MSLDELIDTDFNAPGYIVRKETVEHLTSTTYTDEVLKLSNDFSKGCFKGKATTSNRRNRDGWGAPDVLPAFTKFERDLSVQPGEGCVI